MFKIASKFGSQRLCCPLQISFLGKLMILSRMDCKNAYYDSVHTRKDDNDVVFFPERRSQRYIQICMLPNNVYLLKDTSIIHLRSC